MSRFSELERLFGMSAGYFDGNEGRMHINGMEHALRVATLAYRNSKSREMAFVGLVHDLARPLSDPHHGEVIAEMVRDIVSDDNYHLLRDHGQYQSDFIHRTQNVDISTSWHKMSMAFCIWEVRSFTTNWTLKTMTTAEGLDLMDEFCAGRN